MLINPASIRNVSTHLNQIAYDHLITTNNNSLSKSNLTNFYDVKPFSRESGFLPSL